MKCKNTECPRHDDRYVANCRGRIQPAVCASYKSEGLALAETCGLCGSSDIFSGSWSPDKCNVCGAIGAPNGTWYTENKKENKQ